MQATSAVPPAVEVFDEKPTEIYGELDEEVRAAIEGKAGAPAPRGGSPAQENKVLVSSSGMVPVMKREEPSRPGVTAAGEGMIRPGYQHSGTTQVPGFATQSDLPAPGRRRPARNSNRDVLVGISVAAVLAALILVVAKVAFFSDDAESGEAPKATLVVLVDDRKPAEVWRGDEHLGNVPAGKELVLDRLAPGPTELRIKRAGNEDCIFSKELSAERPSVYTCAFPAPRKGTLLLSDLPGDYQVAIDGKALDNGLAHTAIPLDTGERHRIEIRNPKGVVVDQFELQIGPGEQRRHPVPLEPPATEQPAVEDRSGVEKKTEGGSPVARTPASRSEPEPGRARDDEDRPDEAASEGDEGDEGDQGDDSASEDPADEYGYFTAFTKPWARVLIDDKDTGKMTPISPDSRIKLVPGRHKVTFVVGEERHDFLVKISRGKVKNLVKDLSGE
jgi:hypothetical protein